jgi:hypothetical protein
VPTIVALRQHCENIRRAELERLDYKLASLPRPTKHEPGWTRSAPDHGGPLAPMSSSSRSATRTPSAYMKR